MGQRHLLYQKIKTCWSSSTRTTQKQHLASGLTSLLLVSVYCVCCCLQFPTVKACIILDTDECLENNGGCTQFCHNYIGGYYCSCSSNYELQADGKFCKGNPTLCVITPILTTTLCLVVCNGIVKTDLHGVISSPEYPNTYPDQAQCDWNITLPLGYQIEATFLDMDIEDHHEVKCPYDSLKV